MIKNKARNSNPNQLWLESILRYLPKKKRKDEANKIAEPAISFFSTFIKCNVWRIFKVFSDEINKDLISCCNTNKLILLSAIIICISFAPLCQNIFKNRTIKIEVNTQYAILILITVYLGVTKMAGWLQLKLQNILPMIQFVTHISLLGFNIKSQCFVSTKVTTSRYNYSKIIFFIF